MLGVWARYVSADTSVVHLLATIAGICGGAVAQRRPEGTPATITAVAKYPPTVTAEPVM